MKDRVNLVPITRHNRDFDYIRDLQVQVFHTQVFNALDMWCDTWFRGKGFAYYITINGQRIGYISGYIKLKRLHIQYVMIDPAFQGQGLGEQVFNELSNNQTRYNIMTLHTRSNNTHMQGLMSKLGFTKVDEIKHYYRDGGDAYYYSKSV